MKVAKTFVKKLYEWFCFALSTILSFFVDNDLVVYESFHGMQFSDNPRALYEYALAHYPSLKAVWVVKKGYEAVFEANNITFVYRYSFQWILVMARAKYWIVNTRMPIWCQKGRKTIYVQTWHGTPLKHIGLDVKSSDLTRSEQVVYEKDFKKESDRWNYLVSPNSYSSAIFKKAFEFKGDMIQCRYPRNDVLVQVGSHKDIDFSDSIKEKIGIPKDNFVLLYAPTWRDDKKIGENIYKAENPFPFGQLDDLDNCTILTRFHYLVRDDMGLEKFKNVIDVSSYEDMSHLLLVSEMLITDYSSSMFDYAYTGKPIIFFMYDFDQYNSVTRGLYTFDYSNLPGPIIKNANDLSRYVIALTESAEKADVYWSAYKTQYQIFQRNFCLFHEDSGSEIVWKKIREDEKSRMKI